ncbi:hypothetical protein, partial [Solirhodobacter olei]|uniref:hypothetical protein n=1 Tax=Solirhodobacter olei TaxID=2493082 RepID=UPI0019D43020
GLRLSLPIAQHPAAVDVSGVPMMDEPSSYTVSSGYFRKEQYNNWSVSKLSSCKTATPGSWLFVNVRVSVESLPEQ